MWQNSCFPLQSLTLALRFQATPAPESEGADPTCSLLASAPERPISLRVGACNQHLTSSFCESQAHWNLRTKALDQRAYSGHDTLKIHLRTPFTQCPKKRKKMSKSLWGDWSDFCKDEWKELGLLCLQKRWLWRLLWKILTAPEVSHGIFKNSSPKDMFIDWERKERREGEKGSGESKKNIDVREEYHWLVASCMLSSQGLNPQLRYVLWLGIELATIWCTRRCSNQLNHSDRAHVGFDSHNSHLWWEPCREQRL